MSKSTRRKSHEAINALPRKTLAGTIQKQLPVLCGRALDTAIGEVVRKAHESISPRKKKSTAMAEAEAVLGGKR